MERFRTSQQHQIRSHLPNGLEPQGLLIDLNSLEEAEGHPDDLIVNHILFIGHRGRLGNDIH